MSHPPSNAPRSSGGYARPTSNSAGHATKGQQNVSRQNKASTGSGTSQTNPDAAKPKRQIVGQYMIGRTIGEGTFGKVKLAVHIPTGEKVAIKILEKGRIKEQGDVRRVNREIKILKKTRHGNIIQLFEVLDTKSSIYLIMECAEGGEMFDFIVAQKRVEEVQACKFFHQIVDGIEVLHNNEITHRDLKPENLLLKATPDGWVVKIVDFGLSNTHEGGKYLSTACGSPCYAAPEMIASKKYFGPLADLWSVGVILFALVSGYLPFEDPNTSVLYKKILAGDYTTPKWLSPEVKDLIDCILEVDPRRRYTIKDIRQHAWYRKVSPDQVPQDDITSTNEASKQETLAIMENAGMSAQSVLDGIASHAFNSLTAMYYLLEQKHRARRLQKAHSGSNKISIRQNSSNLSKPETGSDAGGASSVGAAAAAGAQKQQQEQHIQQSSNKENVTSKQKNEHQAAATGAEKTVTGSTTTTTTNGAKDSNRNGAKTNKPIVPSGLKLMSGSNSSASKSPTATAGAAGVTKAGAVDNNNGPKSSHVPMTPYLQAPRMIQQRAAASTAAAGDSSDAVASGGGGGGGDAVASSAGNNSGSQQKQRQGSGSSSRSNNSNKNAVIDINNDRKRHSIGGNGSAGGSISNNSATSKPTKPSGGVSIPPLNLRAVKGTGDGSGASSNRSTSAAMAAATGSSVLRASKPTGTTAGGAAGNTAPKYAVSQTARPAVGSSTGAGAAAAAVVGTGSNSQQPQQQQQQQHRNKAQLVPITSTAPTPAAGAGAPLPATKPTSQLMPVRRPSAGVAPATAGRNPTTTTATTTGAGLVVGASAGTGGNRRASSSSNPTGSSSSSGNHEHSSTNSTSNSSSNAPPPQQASSSSNKMTPVAPSAPKSSAAAVAASTQQSSTGSTPKGSSTTMPKTNVLSDGNATGSGAPVAIAAGGRRGRNLVATTAAAVPDNSAAVES